jgi:F0F1-type ATP synthase assembly protein I
VKHDRATLRAIAVATQLGTAIAASLAIAIGAGYLLDGWLNTRPLFLLLGIIVGLIAAGHTYYDMAYHFERNGSERGKR